MCMNRSRKKNTCISGDLTLDGETFDNDFFAHLEPYASAQAIQFSSTVLNSLAAFDVFRYFQRAPL